MKQRVLLIGLDAADPDLVQGWAREGRLPALGRLLEQGSWARLGSPSNISTGPAWPAFYASANPARQGRFFFRQLRSGTYRIERKSAAEIATPPFWCDLHAGADKRVLIVDVPKTVPHRGIPGVQLVGWGVHSPGHRTASSDSGLVRELRRRFGSYPVPNCDEFPRKRTADFRRFTERLVAGARQKARLSAHLLARERWDLAVTVFGEPHCAGHHLWHLHDSSHPEHDVAQALGDPLREVYEAVDAGIEHVMEAAPDADVLIFSPHGMGPNYGGSHLLPAVLEKLDMAGDKREVTARRGRLSPDSFPLLARRLARRLVPEPLWAELTCRLMSRSNRWHLSRAFCIPGDFAGAIRINRIGREPRGQVAAGAEFDALCAELIRELSRLENADTGRPAVREVLRIDSLYRGPHQDDLPDLAVLWTGDAPVRGLRSPRIGCVRGDDPDRRSGEDREEGFLLAVGPSLARGHALDDGKATTLDVAPTALRLAGFPVPTSMEGRVLQELWSRSGAAQRELDPIR